MRSDARRLTPRVRERIPFTRVHKRRGDARLLRLPPFTAANAATGTDRLRERSHSRCREHAILDDRLAVALGLRVGPRALRQPASYKATLVAELHAAGHAGEGGLSELFAQRRSGYERAHQTIDTWGRTPTEIALSVTDGKAGHLL